MFWTRTSLSLRTGLSSVRTTVRKWDLLGATSWGILVTRTRVFVSCLELGDMFGC